MVRARESERLARSLLGTFHFPLFALDASSGLVHRRIAAEHRIEEQKNRRA